MDMSHMPTATEHIDARSSKSYTFKLHYIDLYHNIKY